MTRKSELGKLGEDLACQYLKKKGYKIIERNYWKPWGELDIIAISPKKILTFVEVKTVNGPLPEITPEEQLTKAKLKKLQRTANLYANHHSNETLIKNGWQIDLVAITINGEKFDLRHYENIS